MKADIHPEYQETTIRCACGNVLEVGSTRSDIRVRFAQNATRFSPVSKSWSILPAELNASVKNMKNFSKKKKNQTSTPTQLR